MLNDPSAFSTAVQALLSSQQHAIDAGSLAGGEYLCFMGSGRDEEDQYVHMVVASFLQRHHKFVCMLFGGFHALHKLIIERGCDHNLLVDHNSKLCLDCQSATLMSPSSHVKDGDSSTSTLFNKLSSVMKPKLSEMKEKLVEYVVNPSNSKPAVKHVSSEKLGKRYKGNKFSLDDALIDYSGTCMRFIRHLFTYHSSRRRRCD